MKLPPEFTAEDRLAAGWIRRMADGDAEALDALYSLYHRSLLRFFGAILRDAGEAEETLQDTYVRAYRHARRYNPEAGVPFVWLATIGRRLAIDRLRRRRSRPGIVVDSGEHTGNPADKEPGNGLDTVHEHLEFAWMREHLQGLPDSQREAIELAFLGGFTHQEIAEKLRRPLGSVKSDLHRGLQHLRNAYLNGDA